jgi:two-component system, OmpR family, sensor kinase
MLGRLSIRSRITIGSLLIATVLFTLALLGVRAQVAAILEQADVTLATNDLTSFAVDLAANPDEGVDDPGTGLQIYITSPTDGVQIDTMPRAIHELLEHREPADEQISAEVGDADYVVVGKTVETPKGTWGLWAARSTQSSEIALDSLKGLFVLGGVLLLLAFGLASWFLASAALRPVVRLQQGAEQLASGGERSSLPVGAADDEIARLARTLNSFLDSVRESADREKRMVSDAAHELRTPLAALKTQLELARADSTEPRLSAQLATAEASVDRLSNLATTLLELARIEQLSTVPQHATATEITDELLSAVDRARLLALSSSVEVDFEVAELSASIGTSASAFARVCDNLLANAVTAAQRRVMVQAHESDGRLQLVVADDGPGMPAEFIGKAFERFSRADDARSSVGSGLGLSLVRAIVEAANGTVTLHNAPAGFEVRVTLPNM